MVQKSLEEWDVLVGMWLRDIPYILRWDPGKIIRTWRSVIRIYLLVKAPPDGVLEEILGSPIQRFKIEGSSLNCTTIVGGYFLAFISGTKIDLKNDHIAINGYKIHFPLYNMTTKQIYNFIGVRHPNFLMLQDWGNKLLIKFDERRPLPPPGTGKVEIVSHLRPSDEEVRLEHNETRSMYLMFWYFRNLGKYPGVCTPVSIVDPVRSTNLQRSYALTILINKQDFSDVSFDFSAIGQYAEIVRFCMKNPKIKKIVIPLSFQYKFLPGNRSHSNLLLIQKGVRNIYLFDPWGKGLFAKVIDLLPKVIDSLGLDSKKWRYYASGDWCPRRSFQRLEIEDIKEGDYTGFCAVWSSWLFENILKNPSVSYPNIVRGSLSELSKSSPNFRKFIREYAKSVEEYGDIIRGKLGIEFLTPKPGDPKPSQGTVPPNWFTSADRKRLYDYMNKQRLDYLRRLEEQDLEDKLVALKSRPSVGNRVWYLRKSKSSYKICSDSFTDVEKQVLKSSLKLKELYHTTSTRSPCYIFYQSHLQKIFKLFPGIQEKID